MKKIVFITLLNLCAVGTFYAQNVVIQSNEIKDSSANEDCEFKIKGICSSEDIGGVEVERKTISSGTSWDWEYYTQIIIVLQLRC